MLYLLIIYKTSLKLLQACLTVNKITFCLMLQENEMKLNDSFHQCFHNGILTENQLYVVKCNKSKQLQWIFCN